MDLPKECPQCKKRKWKVFDSESHETIVDLEKGDVFPNGTLIRDIKCAYCNYQDRNYQKTR